MKRFSRIAAAALALTMVMATAVSAASSPSTGNTTTTSSQSSSAPAPAYSQSVQSVQEAQLAAPAATFAAGITSATAGGAAVAVAPVPVSAVNYATLGAKLIVGPTATVLKAVELAPMPGAKSDNVTLAIPGIVKGQKLTVIAFDPITKTWVKISGVKVRNGQISFRMGKYNIFSIVSDTIAP